MNSARLREELRQAVRRAQIVYLSKLAQIGAVSIRKDRKYTHGRCMHTCMIPQTPQLPLHPRFCLKLLRQTVLESLDPSLMRCMGFLKGRLGGAGCW